MSCSISGVKYLRICIYVSVAEHLHIKQLRFEFPRTNCGYTERKGKPALNCQLELITKGAQTREGVSDGVSFSSSIQGAATI